MIVCGQSFTRAWLRRIQRYVDRTPRISRRALSRKVCEWLSWRSENGRLKQVSCRVALKRLEGKGELRLPVGGKRLPRKRRVGRVGVRRWQVTRCELKDLGDVDLVKVGSAGGQASCEWNALMERYHYLKSGPLCGAQMRYLIRSSTKGWLGGLAFSGAAWRVRARDEWIGWDESARRENLQRVVCNSRFLICPQVRVSNLASYVLAKSAVRVRADWKVRYGYEPLLLETFVAKDRFKGSCYRAANWIHVGASQGRGRQDQKHRRLTGVKDMYVYPLSEQAREHLRVCGAGSAEPLAEKPEGKPERSWSENEFGGAPLGDERLEKRLVTLGEDFYARPQASIPQACGSRAKTKAAYRFFEHEKTSLEPLLAPHLRATEERIRAQRVVLAVQDTTSLNYATHRSTEGLGSISNHAAETGLEVHGTMAFDVEGTPLGLLDVQCWARMTQNYGKHTQRKKKPIEEKESYKWLKSYQKVAQIQKRCPGTMLVSVGDREADIYELFQLALKDPSGPALLIRAQQPRQGVGQEGSVWENLAKKRCQGIHALTVPRRGNRAARKASLEVRFAEVCLRPPGKKKGLDELTVRVILAEEKNPPAGINPLKWMLLTTLPVRTLKEAIEKLQWYAKRWGIEVYHRTLKSGCKIEDRRLGHADRIEACLAIDMVVAWRIFYLCKLGRETPDVPCTVFFEEAEWKALVCHTRNDPTPPVQPPTLREATRMAAALGGFLGRNRDGEPGTESLWIGLQRLDDLAAMWTSVVRRYAPHLLAPPVSSNPGYG